MLAQASGGPYPELIGILCTDALGDGNLQSTDMASSGVA